MNGAENALMVVLRNVGYIQMKCSPRACNFVVDAAIETARNFQMKTCLFPQNFTSYKR